MENSLRTHQSSWFTPVGCRICLIHRVQNSSCSSWLYMWIRECTPSLMLALLPDLYDFPDPPCLFVRVRLLFALSLWHDFVQQCGSWQLTKCIPATEFFLLACFRCQYILHMYSKCALKSTKVYLEKYYVFFFTGKRKEAWFILELHKCKLETLCFVLSN